MAKKRKKQRKNNKMPPLHWVDKLIYIAIIAILTAICLALLFYVILGIEQQYFNDPTVIAFNRHASELWYLPTFFLFFIIIMAIGYRYTERYPIFGIPNFRYGPSKYPRIYPLFSKDKPKKKTTPDQRKRIGMLWGVLITIALSILSTYPLSFYGRDCLNQNGSITVYNAANKETAEYQTSEITEIAIRFYRYTTGASTSKVRFRHRHYSVAIRLTSDDGREFSFKARDFRGKSNTEWLNEMLQIKNRFSPDIITYDTVYADHFFADNNLTEEEKDLLYQLFNME